MLDITQLKPLIDRISLSMPFEEFLSVVEKNYPSIGSIIECAPILQGYESANFVLTTNRGKFVLKVLKQIVILRISRSC